MNGLFIVKPSDLHTSFSAFYSFLKVTKVVFLIWLPKHLIYSVYFRAKSIKASILHKIEIDESDWVKVENFSRNDVTNTSIGLSFKTKSWNYYCILVILDLNLLHMTLLEQLLTTRHLLLGNELPAEDMHKTTHDGHITELSLRLREFAVFGV